MDKDSNSGKDLKNFLEQFNEKPKTREQKELWGIADKVVTNIKDGNNK